VNSRLNRDRSAKYEPLAWRGNVDTDWTELMENYPTPEGAGCPMADDDEAGYPRIAQSGRSFVYLLPSRDEDVLKFGFSCDPLQRLQALHRRFSTSQHILAWCQDGGFRCPHGRDLTA
jgi:hypothetical protein